ncbi:MULTISPECIES: metal ABC transporter ATP-binding protein [Geobacillus]|uniref:Metal (Zinc) ABC transporter (ATP-binding protein) n=7 Tax=Geobacillus TaxID=129337 RepID=Q5KX30_GEOKA|nr:MULTISPECIES: ABC transporter ATP-binding protein [Geobacillus]AEV20089.1 ABC transporter ATP-binding protein [Geobacillus thermoleovorans CCB_US3_UF5]AMV11645.1 zinc ABC transporter ATP-binding protein [Geobacillus thermoleovorans]AOL35197.1 zinc ABC transporter ATP-binding protein [Geobacillus thermoleovorans]AUI37836.1 ABC transporter ATP-binding protein [[Bacillus] caldolyticus]AWO75399.1 ABC transporter ATP-binding protein [Geobacillus thermoleovorans]
MENGLVVQIEDVSFRYENENVLEHVSLTVPKGAFLGLVGPNGSGKSTLLKCVLGLLKPNSGRIFLFGEPIESFREWHRIGFVSQKANSFNRSFPATVEEVAASGLAAKRGLFRPLTHEDRRAVEAALAAVGLSGLAKRNIAELSGGQQQRVFIARALASKPDLLILDEPTVGVDARHVHEFYELLGDLNRRGLTLILVTHDIGTITDRVTDIACLNKRLYFHGKAEEFEHLGNEAISQFYGHPLHVLSHEHERAE